MLVPPSFGLAFEVEHATALEVQKWAGSRLRNRVCEPNEFLFRDRLKSEESALAKALYGPFPSLRDMPDLYGALVVVPTQNEIDRAIDAIREAFPASEVIRKRRRDPERFSYDDVHVHARLDKVAAGVAPDGVRQHVFEIQVRTGLQYAWWRATHDNVYKGARDWKLLRTASQVRASLELLDSMLANLSQTAELQVTDGSSDELERAEAGRLLDYWGEDQRPENVAGFIDAVLALSTDAKRSLEEVRGLLDSERGVELRGQRTIPPVQVILTLLVEDAGPAFVKQLKRRHRYVLVTDELLAVSDEVQAIDNSRRVSLATS